jgi:hypothetical protein
MMRVSVFVVIVLVASAVRAYAQPSWCPGIDQAHVGVLLGGYVPTLVQNGPEQNADAAGIATTVTRR